MKLTVFSAVPVAAMLLLLSSSICGAFCPTSLPRRHLTSSSSSSLAATAMDAEALLAKARQLKAEAAAAEADLHKNLLEKQDTKNQDLDAMIDKLFPIGDTSVEGVATRLQQHHWSTDRVMQIVRRLHDREIVASGKGHVVAAARSTTGGAQGFDRVTKSNPQELQRVHGLIDRLLEAAELIDEDYMKVKRQAKEQQYLSHNDLDHWTVGDLAGHLRRQVGELRREHDGQFQERLESFYEAQRKEKKHPPKDNNSKKDDSESYWP